jgi:hypothetical protein
MTPTNIRALLASNDYTPLPCIGKKPVLKEWQTRSQTSEDDLAMWARSFPDAVNTGVLTALMPVLDLDILDAGAVDAAVAMVRRRFENRGKIMLRTGRAPKVAIPFRTDTPFKKVSVALIAPEDAVGQKIELLCEGQQAVVDGIHPDTNAPYQWSGGDLIHVKRDELPSITADEAQELVGEIAAMLTLHFNYTIAEEPAGGNGADPDGRVDWGRLYENIRVGSEYHQSLRDLACNMIAAKTDPGAVVNILRDLMMQSEAPHDARWQERYDDIPRAVNSAVRRVSQTTPEKVDRDAEVARLATLPLAEYEAQRKSVAEKLDYRASVLDKLVDAKRAELGLNDIVDNKQGQPITFPKIEPWSETVDGAALLDELDAALARHLVMTKVGRTIGVVWVVHTHLFDRFNATPRLCIRSVAKGSGKTAVFNVISHLLPKVVQASSASPSSIFRLLDAYHPTLLLDEAAGMFDEQGELRRILNSGYLFNGFVLRNVGDDIEPRQFNVFSPVAFALIGKLPSDLHSRCVCIDMKRKLKGEKIDQYRVNRMQHLDVLNRKIARWVADNVDTIARIDPALPPDVINRSADLWAVLLSIATVAGGDWLDRIRQAIVASTGIDDDDSEDFEKAIVDIHKILEEREAIPSKELVGLLADMEDRPWAEYGRSRKPITQNALAQLLRGPGFAIVPYQIRFQQSDGTWVQLRGYAKWQFEEAFARYLSPSIGPSYPPDRHNDTNVDGTGISGVTAGVTVEADVTVEDGGTSRDDDGFTDRHSRNFDEIGICDDVTDRRVVGAEGSMLPGMLDPARVLQLIDWARKRNKDLRSQMGMVNRRDTLKWELRDMLAKELHADLVNDTADRIMNAAIAKTAKEEPQ